MPAEVIFGSMSPEGRKFYSRVFNTALLNMWAVRNGLFDTFLCESEDPRIMIRWKAAVPNIVQTMMERRLDPPIGD